MTKRIEAQAAAEQRIHEAVGEYLETYDTPSDAAYIEVELFIDGTLGRVIDTESRT